ncbi:MAG: formylmethanofuran dehydrogenase subunit C [Methanolinea sp.]|nr:formylmethanofuran dehydrogenase subunit C [Methanolinea sp.]
METVTITMKNQPKLYLEADNVSPDKFAGKKASEIAALHAYEGREQTTLGKYFEIAGEGGATAADTRIIVKGDVSRVKYIGMKMSAGEVLVEQSPDMYTGAWMQGGKLVVKGNVDSFAGIGMKGGEFLIDGNAGDYLGAAYRGDWRGMQGGLIRVKGSAGSDIGYFMNGGTIIVHGNTDVHVGTHMEGGRIVIKGNAPSKVGGQMVGGEIFVYGTIDVMMPGFKYVQDEEVEVDGERSKFALYYGDTGERHPKRKGQIVYGKLYLKI